MHAGLSRVEPSPSAAARRSTAAAAACARTRHDGAVSDECSKEFIFR